MYTLLRFNVFPMAKLSDVYSRGLGRPCDVWHYRCRDQGYLIKVKYLLRYSIFDMYKYIISTYRYIVYLLIKKKKIRRPNLMYIKNTRVVDPGVSSTCRVGVWRWPCCWFVILLRRRIFVRVAHARHYTCPHDDTCWKTLSRQSAPLAIPQT
jgi:hypothetical protein